MATKTTTWARSLRLSSIRRHWGFPGELRAHVTYPSPRNVRTPWLQDRRQSPPTNPSCCVSFFHSSSPRFQQQEPKVEELFQRILQLDLFEVHMLNELLNKRMGVAMPDANRATATGGKQQAAQPEQVKEEKTLFDLKLTGFDAKAKIKVIKEVRAIAGLGLKEAKELVEGAPKVIKKDIKPEEAEELKTKLEDVGATVEVS